MIRNAMLYLCAASISFPFAVASYAQSLEVPFKTQGGCGQTRVWGLDPKGDGFLAVRSGPDSKYEKLDELHNGDHVFIFAERGPWMGVVYGVASSSHCNVPANAKRGWVHMKWLDIG